ncbi:hypothetical protein [Yoonia sp. 76]|uniref:hypothetical protein n=1 Tax=Yoonia sp. 76 TaxID=3081451 RepID=UPI002AFECA05|nr:hypothetical protein [Yoonia sp. 76]
MHNVRYDENLLLFHGFPDRQLRAETGGQKRIVSRGRAALCEVAALLKQQTAIAARRQANRHAGRPAPLNHGSRLTGNMGIEIFGIVVRLSGERLLITLSIRIAAMILTSQVVTSIPLNIAVRPPRFGMGGPDKSQLRRTQRRSNTSNWAFEQTPNVIRILRFASIATD